jgi:nucleotide-binding universal stress UspA family protein
MKPILLALSTCRQTDLLVQQTIALARQENRDIIVLFVVDACKELELINSQTIAGTHFRQRCHEELLAECKETAEATVKTIASQAIEAGVSCETIVMVGRFRSETVNAIKERNLDKVALARSGQSRWIRKLLGSPTDYIAAHTDCQVLEYGNNHIF